jgi:hypothetical protein
MRRVSLNCLRFTAGPCDIAATGAPCDRPRSSPVKAATSAVGSRAVGFRHASRHRVVRSLAATAVTRAISVTSAFRSAAPLQLALFHKRAQLTKGTYTVIDADEDGKGSLAPGALPPADARRIDGAPIHQGSCQGSVMVTASIRILARAVAGSKKDEYAGAGGNGYPERRETRRPQALAATRKFQYLNHMATIGERCARRRLGADRGRRYAPPRSDTRRWTAARERNDHRASNDDRL